MKIKPPDFKLNFYSGEPKVLVSMIGTLFAALQEAIRIKTDEIATVFASDREARLAAFDQFAKQVRQKAKGLDIEGGHIDHEAVGMTDGLRLIEQTLTGLRSQL